MISLIPLGDLQTLPKKKRYISRHHISPNFGAGVDASVTLMGFSCTVVNKLDTDLWVTLCVGEQKVVDISLKTHRFCRFCEMFFRQQPVLCGRY